MLETAPYIFSNIAVASLLAMLAWLVGRSDRHAALAHLLWVSVFLKLITPAIAVLEIPVPAEWCPDVLRTADTTPDRGNANSGNTSHSHSLHNEAHSAPPLSGSIAGDRSVDHSTPSTAWGIGSLLPQHAVHLVGTLWLLGFVFVVIRGGRRFVRLQTLIRSEGEIDEAASEFVNQLVRRHFHVSTAAAVGPSVIRLPIRISPMLFGAGRRTVVVCPELLWDAFTAEEREAFLAHEAAHFCRRDHWVRWIEWLASAVYWWFPPLHLARRQLERHEEVCCDLWAVEHLQTTRRSYAEALLKAVDFMSGQHGATPRLASSMQATENLEHRLRLVMVPDRQPVTAVHGWLIAVVATSALLLHPQLTPALRSADHVRSQAISAAPAPLSDVGSVVETNSPSVRPLPPEPQGFWNQMPPSQWARFSLSLESATVTADSDRGLRIQTPGNDDLLFTRDELTSLVCLPVAKRILIGAADGSLRIWDLEVARPVSLVGRHSAAIVSLDYHAQCGLISADANGVIVRWNMQSGERLASWHATTNVQSVRFNSDGGSLAVLSGHWDSSAPQKVEILDAQSLEPISAMSLNLPAATVVPTAEQQWLLIDWAGNVRVSPSERLITRIAKMRVSALVFASSLSVPQTNLPPEFGRSSDAMQNQNDDRPTSFPATILE